MTEENWFLLLLLGSVDKMPTAFLFHSKIPFFWGLNGYLLFPARLSSNVIESLTKVKKIEILDKLIFNF